MARIDLDHLRQERFLLLPAILQRRYHGKVVQRVGIARLIGEHQGELLPRLGELAREHEKTRVENTGRGGLGAGGKSLLVLLQGILGLTECDRIVDTLVGDLGRGRDSLHGRMRRGKTRGEGHQDEKKSRSRRRPGASYGVGGTCMHDGDHRAAYVIPCHVESFKPPW